VLDQLRRPVADVDITTVWTANEGRMEPWGHHPTKTDAHGRFSMTMRSVEYRLLAIDKEWKRGALIVIDPRNAPSSVDVKLVPLVRLHGRVRIAATGLELKDVLVHVRLLPNEKGMERLARC
jgi:hypothetical protein